VSELLRRELATLIAREINDNRIRHVSINGVRVSRDLKHATVYFSRLENSPGARQTTKEGADQPTDEQLLNRAAGFLRHLLSQHADLRITPTLRFKYDDSIRRGVEMTTLIDRLNRSDDG
jgi:ribosome-binding factor A